MMYAAFAKEETVSLDIPVFPSTGDLQFRLILDAVQDYAIYMLDTQGHIKTWNGGAEQIKGYSRAEIVGRHFSCFFTAEDQAEGIPKLILAETLAAGHFTCEGWRVRKDGARFWASVVLDTIRDDQGVLVGFAKVTRDLTERKRQEVRLLESEVALHAESEHLTTTLHSIADGVVCTDDAGIITLVNPAAEKMTGWSLGESVECPVESVLQLVDSVSGEAVVNPIRACLEDGCTYHLRDGVALVARDGTRVEIQDSAAPIRGVDGLVSGAILVFQDVTRLRSIQREIQFHATHDALTTLPNRREFEIRLDGAIRRSESTGVPSIACFLDLDRFKIVNDTAGHAAGDVLLKIIGHLITKHIRVSDLVARLGGDEFGIILYSCAEDQAVVTVTKIMEGIEALPFHWENRTFRISSSIGVAMITPKSTVAGVMKQVDVACYAAKHLGRNRFSIYRPDESEGHERHRELHIAADVREAIAEDRFLLYAQKIVGMDGSLRPRFELLLRMRERDGGIVEPALFIPAAERFGLMVDLDRWVIQTVLGGYGGRLKAIDGVQVCVNLSGDSLNDPKFLPFFLDTLARSELPASAVTMEITETALINNLSNAGTIIETIRAAGCKVALDDFGIGLSSFSYLRNFKVDFIKIEGSFVRNALDSAVDLAIVKSINNVAHEIHTQTIAEHVESEAILRTVVDLKIDFAQGFGLGRPEPIEHIFV